MDRTQNPEDRAELESDPSPEEADVGQDDAGEEDDAGDTGSLRRSRPDKSRPA